MPLVRRATLQMVTAFTYRTGSPAIWDQGDFNGGPGGSASVPPVGDGVFDEDDIMAALITGLYNAGPYSPDPFRPQGVPNLATVLPFDGNPGLITIHYDAGLGTVLVTTPPGVTISSILIELDTTEDVFILSASPFKGAFDFVTAQSLFVGSFNVDRDIVDFGAAAATALLEDFWLSHLQVKGTLHDSGPGQITQVAFEYIAGKDVRCNSRDLVVYVAFIPMPSAWTNSLLQLGMGADFDSKSGHDVVIVSWPLLISNMLWRISGASKIVIFL